MGYRGWKRFLQTFRGEHDFGAFFAFVSSVYRVFALPTKGARGTKTNVIVDLW